MMLQKMKLKIAQYDVHRSYCVTVSQRAHKPRLLYFAKIASENLQNALIYSGIVWRQDNIISANGRNRSINLSPDMANRAQSHAVRARPSARHVRLGARC